MGQQAYSACRGTTGLKKLQKLLATTSALTVHQVVVPRSAFVQLCMSFCVRYVLAMVRGPMSLQQFWSTNYFRHVWPYGESLKFLHGRLTQITTIMTRVRWFSLPSIPYEHSISPKPTCSSFLAGTHKAEVGSALHLERLGSSAIADQGFV